MLLNYVAILWLHTELAYKELENKTSIKTKNLLVTYSNFCIIVCVSALISWNLSLTCSKFQGNLNTQWPFLVTSDLHSDTVSSSCWFSDCFLESCFGLEGRIRAAFQLRQVAYYSSNFQKSIHQTDYSTNCVTV